MKKTAIALFGCLAAFSLVAQNLLKNPDFEEIQTAKLKERLKKYLWAEEIPTGWTVRPPGNPAKFTVVTDGETSKKGSCYLRVEQLDPQKDSSCCQWWIPVKGGRKYKFSVWTKGKGSIMLHIVAYGKKKNVLRSFRPKTMTPIPSETEWNLNEFEIEMPEGAVEVVASYLMRGTVDLDDAFFGPVEQEAGK